MKFKGNKVPDKQDEEIVASAARQYDTVNNAVLCIQKIFKNIHLTLK